MTVYTNEFEYRISYTSSDGINYTRTSFQDDQGNTLENPVDFNTIVKFGNPWGEAEWNDAIGYFMIIGNTSYEGLYKYNGTNTQYELANTQLNAIDEAIYGSKSFYGENGVQTGILQNITDLTLNQLNTRINLYNDLSYLELNENITDTCNLFHGSSLVLIPNFNTSNITNMADTFARSFYLTLAPNLNMSNTTDTKNMFYYCNNLIDVPEYNMSNVTSMENMYYTCDNLSNKSLDNIANSVPISSQVNNALIFHAGLSASKFSNEAKDILFNKGYVDCDRNTSEWSTMYNINGTSYYRGDDFDRYATNLSNIIAQNYNTSTIISINIGADGTDNGILLLFPSFRYKLPNVKSVNIALNTCNIIGTDYKFEGCYNLTSVSNFDTHNVKKMDCMFESCRNLTTVPNYNTCNVTNMYSMFGTCYSLTSVPQFNTINVTNMGYMFGRCNNLTTVPNFDTSNVTDMSTMFGYCDHLTTIPNFNTSNVVHMASTFESCLNLTTVPNFDTRNVTNMYALFQSCQNLTTVPNFDTSNVTNMWGMFYECKKIASIPQFNTSNVTNMTYMFRSCNNLTTIPNFDTSNVTDMSTMFEGCYNLTDMPQLNTSNVTNMRCMFFSCNNLSNASIQNIINMCLNSNITNSTMMNLNNEDPHSPLRYTKFDNSYYQNRWSELTAAGWTY